MKKRVLSLTGKVGIIVLLLSVIFLPFSGSICFAAESAAAAASEGTETKPVAPPEKPAALEKPVPSKPVVPYEPSTEGVAAAGEAGKGATKGVKGKTNVWYIALGVAAIAGLAAAAGGGGGGGGGTTPTH